MLDAVRRDIRWRRQTWHAARLARRHPLRYLFFEVTRRCNLHCAYCGSACDSAARHEELLTSRWVAIAREVAHDFQADRVMIGVTGGEPLLKQGIFDLLAELGHLGFRFGMITNGTQLDLDAARRIVTSGMGSISLSMDAPPPLGDRLRGAGVGEKVERAIDNLRAAGYRGAVEICSTLTRPAVSVLAEMRRHVGRLGVSRWRVLIVMPLGRAVARPDLLLRPGDVRTVLEFVRRARADLRRPRPEFTEECYLGDRYEGAVRPCLFGCRAGITVAGILHDGRIGACPELPDAFVQGDVRKERFKTVWEHRYQVFRDRRWTLRGACATCDAYSRCLGGSLHLYPAPGQDFFRCTYRDLAECPAEPRGSASNTR